MSDTADRFRNPQFCSAWSRWFAALHAWRRAMDRHSPRTDPYDPVPGDLPEHLSHIKPVAQEYLDARSAYKAERSRWNMDGTPDSP
jgi:hypothetical protein